MRIILFIGLALCITSCATNKETVYWERGKHSTITVHHVRKTNKGTSDRTEELTAKVIEPGLVHAYDLGRMPDGTGGMSEAHRYYRVVQSESFDLRLPPASKLHPTGPKSVYTPPNYSPPPKDQRINDAVTEAHQAKDKLDSARGKIEEQIAQDNNLRGALQDQVDENEHLRQQLDSAMSARPPSAPAGTPQSDASKAGQQAADPLAQWGSKINSGQ
jgi:hypothetical protein